MKKYVIFLILIMCLLTMVSCETKGSDGIIFRETPFKSEISWENDNREYRAILTSSGVRRARNAENNVEINNQKPTVTLEYVFPENLEGIKVAKKGDKIIAALGEAKLISSDVEKMYLPAEVIFAQGKVKIGEEKIIDGKKCKEIRVFSQEGIATYYINKSSKAPQRAVFEFYNDFGTKDDLVIDFKWTEWSTDKTEQK